MLPMVTPFWHYLGQPQKKKLEYLGEITGIADLIYDPSYQGSGISESNPGEFLPVHVDFNYHPDTRHHRRLKILLYLNERWEQNWGGNIELHKNPRVHLYDSLEKSYTPINNR